MTSHFAKLAPGLIAKIKKEHSTLQKLISDHHLDAVISDNRFGLWTEQVPCVFMTHQLTILSPLLQAVIRKINYRFIDRYTWCWVPDFPTGASLAGKLSHPDKSPRQCAVYRSTFAL